MNESMHNKSMDAEPVVPGGEPRDPAVGDPVVVDCDTCLVRSAAACGDCVVTVLLGEPPEGVILDDAEVSALDVLAREGLVPPLRLVTPLTSPDIEAS